MYRWLLLPLVAIPLLLTEVRPAAPSLVWWTTTGLEKVRPYDNPPAKLNDSVQLYAARNEFEPFQIVFRAESQDIQGMDIEVSDFEGPGKRQISSNNFTVYFEKFMELARPSSIEGSAGEWPDPLVPRVDRYAKEKRNAFPFELKGGRNQPIWIETYVPPSTPPGTYTGNVVVTIKTKRYVTIPVTLNVWKFSLPSTSSLPTTFGFNGISAVHQHLGKYTNDTDVLRFTTLYRKAALWHRLSLHGGSLAPPQFHFEGDRIEVNWDTFDAEIGPFLDGTVIAPDDPLYGAKATTACVRVAPSLKTDEQKISYWKAVANHFRKKGWIKRLFNYLPDEPEADQFDELLHQARLAHSADPDIRNLVTSQLHSSWTGAIDIWTPLINCFIRRPGFGNFCGSTVTRTEYDSELSKGAELWWYQSCGSHGCDIVGGEYYRGWPSYMIDNTGISNRIMSWMTWKYDTRGELYYTIDKAYEGKGADPWKSVYHFGGNGDGTLVYPGRPDVIGGQTDIPIESIRLKLIREGLEDYEYLTLLTRLSGSSVTKDFVNSLVTNAYTYEHDPKMLYEVRLKIGEEINRLGVLSN